MTIQLKDEGVQVASAISALDFVGDRQQATIQSGDTVGTVFVDTDFSFDTFEPAYASFIATQYHSVFTDQLITSVTLTDIENMVWDSGTRKLHAGSSGYFILLITAKSDYINSRLCEPSFRGNPFYSTSFIANAKSKQGTHSDNTWCSEADYPPQVRLTVSGKRFWSALFGVSGTVVSFPPEVNPTPPAEDYLVGDAYAVIQAKKLREFTFPV